MKLSRLHEDKDLTPGGSKEYSATEAAVYPKHTASGPGVKAPPKGDVSQIVDVGSPGYSTDTLIPSQIHRKGQKPKVDRLKI
jgi:hypothetical protein